MSETSPKNVTAFPTERIVRPQRAGFRRAQPKGGYAASAAPRRSSEETEAIMHDVLAEAGCPTLSWILAQPGSQQCLEKYRCTAGELIAWGDPVVDRMQETPLSDTRRDAITQLVRKHAKLEQLAGYLAYSVAIDGELARCLVMSRLEPHLPEHEADLQQAWYDMRDFHRESLHMGDYARKEMERQFQLTVEEKLRAHLGRTPG